MRWPQTDLAAVALALALGAMPWAALAQSDGTAGGAALQAKWRELQPQLRTSAFDQPIYVSADDSAERLSGDLYAEMELPFAEVGAALRSPAALCKWLFLHVSIHACLKRGCKAGLHCHAIDNAGAGAAGAAAVEIKFSPVGC